MDVVEETDCRLNYPELDNVLEGLNIVVFKGNSKQYVFSAESAIFLLNFH